MSDFSSSTYAMNPSAQPGGGASFNLGQVSYIKRRRLNVGLEINILLAVSKLILSQMVHSQALLADGLDNLSDSVSSVVNVASLRLAKRPPDEKHPFGYQRMEYLSSFVLGIMIVYVSVTVMKHGLTALFHGNQPGFSWLWIALSLISISVKCFMHFYYKRPITLKSHGKKSSSHPQVQHFDPGPALEAASADSLADVLNNSAVLVSVILNEIWPWYWDSLLSVGISLMIFRTGFEVLKDTTKSLLGESPDPGLLEEVRAEIRVHPQVVGVHDIIVHNYGTGHSNRFITAHVALPATLSFQSAHEVVDAIERDLVTKFNAQFLLHMDPYVPLDALSKQFKALCRKVLETYEEANKDQNHETQPSQGQTSLEPGPTIHDYQEILTAGAKNSDLVKLGADKVSPKYGKNQNYYPGVVEKVNFDVELPASYPKTEEGAEAFQRSFVPKIQEALAKVPGSRGRALRARYGQAKLFINVDYEYFSLREGIEGSTVCHPAPDLILNQDSAPDIDLDSDQDSKKG